MSRGEHGAQTRNLRNCERNNPNNWELYPEEVT